jgi:hypothetical protein
MRGALVASFALLALVVCDQSQVVANDTIRIWKTGSPHRGDTPAATVPAALQEAASRLGITLVVEAFPARGFAAMFREAVARNAAPDVLSFDNFGVMTGITTPLGTFEGISHESTVQKDFVRVTGAFDDLLGPERGWNFLVPFSPNHKAAKALALRPPGCPPRRGRPLRVDLAEIVPRLATAYVEGNAFALQSSFDTDRLLTSRSRPESTTVASVRPCGWWGNDQLVFAQVNVTYEAESSVGQALVLLVLRKPSTTWQLLVASRDPISNGQFWEQAALRTTPLSSSASASPPLPATLLSPGEGLNPRPPDGQRFGTFEWQSSPSADVVAEIVEFAYEDDARLFFGLRVIPEARLRFQPASCGPPGAPGTGACGLSTAPATSRSRAHGHFRTDPGA